MLTTTRPCRRVVDRRAATAVGMYVCIIHNTAESRGLKGEHKTSNSHGTRNQTTKRHAYRYLLLSYSHDADGLPVERLVARVLATRCGRQRRPGPVLRALPASSNPSLVAVHTSAGGSGAVGGGGGAAGVPALATTSARKSRPSPSIDDGGNQSRRSVSGYGRRGGRQRRMQKARLGLLLELLLLLRLLLLLLELLLELRLLNFLPEARLLLFLDRPALLHLRLCRGVLREDGKHGRA